MPQQQKEKFEGALDSIFKFIFANANKPPQKGMPPSRAEKGMSGADPFTEALGEFVEKPFLAGPDSILGAIDGAVGGPTLVETHLAKPDPTLYPNQDPLAGRLRVRVGDIATFLKDPSAYIDGVYKNYNASKSKMKLAALGRGLDVAAGFLYGSIEGGLLKNLGVKAGETQKEKTYFSIGTDALDFALASGQFVGMGGWFGGMSRRDHSTLNIARTAATDLSSTRTVEEGTQRGDQVYQALENSGARIDSYTKEGPVFGFFAQPEKLDEELVTSAGYARAEQQAQEQVQKDARARVSSVFMDIYENDIVASNTGLSGVATPDPDIRDPNSEAKSGLDILKEAIISGEEPDTSAPTDANGNPIQSAKDVREAAARAYRQYQAKFEEMVSTMRGREQSFVTELGRQGFSQAEVQEIIRSMREQADVRKKHFITDPSKRPDHFTPGAYRATFINYQSSKLRKMQAELGKLRAVRSVSGHGPMSARERELEAKINDTRKKIKLIETWQEVKGDVGIFNSKVYSNSIKAINELIEEADALGDSTLKATLENNYLSQAGKAQYQYHKAIGKRSKGREAGEVFGGRARAFEWSGYTKSANQALQARLGAELKVIESKLEKARNANMTHRIHDLESQMEAILLQQKKMKFLKWAHFRISTGNALIAVDSLKNMWSGGLLSFGGLMSGSAFFSNALFSPGSIDVFRAASIYKRKGEHGAKAWGVDHFQVNLDGPKDGFDVVNTLLVTPKEGPMYDVNKFLVNFYYLTPASLIKTFGWNGEGFKYISTMANRSGAKMLGNIIAGNDVLKREVFKIFKNCNDDSIIKMLAGLKDKNGHSLFATDAAGNSLFDMNGDVLKEFLAGGDFNTLISEHWGFLFEKLAEIQDGPESTLQRILATGNFQRYLPQLKKLLDKAERFRKLGRTFQMPSIMYNKLVTRLKKKFLDPIQNKVNAIVKKALMKLFKNQMSTEWMKTVIKFLGKEVGLNTLIKVGVQAILQGIGIATTSGLANIVVAVVTWVAPKLIEKGGKQLLKALAVVVQITVFALVMFGCMSISMVAGLLPAAHQTPTQVSGRIGGSGGAVASGTGLEGVGNPEFWKESEGVDGYGSSDGAGSAGAAGPSQLGTEQPWEDNGVQYNCPMNGKGYSCAQGSHPTNPNWSHANLPAVDFTAYKTFKAPTDLTVTLVVIGPTNGCGTHVEAKDDNGNIFRLYHVTLVGGIGVGSKLSRGQDWANMQTNLTPNACWTGPHYHLDIRDSTGTYYDAEAWMRDKCSSGTITKCAGE